MKLSVDKRILYFKVPGEQCTQETFQRAKERAEELGIKDLVVASTTGETGIKACEYFRGYNLTVVSHYTGFKEPGVQQMSLENREKIRKLGGRLLTCTHAFQGVERGIREKFATAYPVEIMAQTLRLFGEGVKVAVEISLMAADAGLIPHDREIIAIAGTNRGADTALVLQPANTTRVFSLKVKEIIAKPRLN